MQTPKPTPTKTVEPVLVCKALKYLRGANIVGTEQTSARPDEIGLLIRVPRYGTMFAYRVYTLWIPRASILELWINKEKE